MTPERLAEIERLANEATPAPWEWDLDVFNEDGEIESCVGAGIPIAMLFRAATGLKTTTDGNTRETWHKAEKAQEAKDAAYIAAANPAALLDLIAHIRDLEAQVREAREALSLAYLELGDGGHPGFREANRAAMAVYERYFDHHDPTGKTIHELREAALATATPPSPEVDYRREGEHGRPLPNNWPSPEVGE